MKRTLFYSLFSVAVIFMVTSCLPMETYFDEALLIGKWQQGTLNYRYDTGGTGVTWDTADDVTEAEGQGFTWVLDQSELTHIYLMEISGSTVTKIYTVTKLTATTLEYSDDFGKSYSFTKVN